MVQPPFRSYDLKVDRAEKHLIELEFEIRRYTRRHPYRARPRVEGKRKVYRLEYTRQPDDELAVIAADFVYNIRSALDHLAASMVPSKNRSRVAFPILWQGVWEDPIEGENKQRLKDRERWVSYTREMPDQAVAILKRNQPPDLGPNVENTTDTLTMLNRLRNRDAHTKLMVVSSHLLDPTVRFETPDGEIREYGGLTSEREGLSDGAEIEGIPEDAMNVEISGSPKITIRVGKVKGGILVREVFRNLLLAGTRTMIDLLRPYEWSR